MSLFSWLREAPPASRRALLAACLGWALDSFDVNLYALVLASLLADLEMTKATAGLVGSATLVSAAIGGIAFGMIADRYGRTRALMGSILIYSIFTGACGLAQTWWQLLVFRVLLGFGMGGEWASGAALVSETWPAEHRGKALGLVQSSWAVGFAAAALMTQVVLPIWGWRVVFFLGVLPALVTAWVRRHVEEPEIWQRSRAQVPEAAASAGPGASRLRDIFRGPMLRLTVFVTLMNACTLFAYWGFTQWVPAYLELPPDAGGLGLGGYKTALIVAMNVGMWFGYVTFGLVSDTLGRKRTYVAYVLAAAVFVMAYAIVRTPVALLLLGPFVGFFGAGYFSGFGAVTAEIYPTRIRATAQGFTYNLGRIGSALAPFTVGSLAQSNGFTAAFSTVAAAFVLAGVAWIWIPETRGRELA
ncbi:MAG TPA: MFS transporter [Vicinamibacterales bacterium]|nr:MFS transporter [Vicinamibacterales bacterium]